MADSIPDSPNKLGQSTEGCVTCGIQVNLFLGTPCSSLLLDTILEYLVVLCD